MYTYVLVGIMATFCCYNSFASDCLEKIWIDHNSTELEKKYDIENDTGQYGSSYSCNTGLSASQITEFLNGLDVAVASGDINKLSEMFNYPFHVLGISKRDLKVVNKKQFKLQYKIIITPMIIRLQRCSNLKNLIMANGGLTMGLGSVSFAGLYENKKAEKIRIFEINLRHTAAEMKNLDDLNCR